MLAFGRMYTELEDAVVVVAALNSDGVVLRDWTTKTSVEYLHKACK